LFLEMHMNVAPLFFLDGTDCPNMCSKFTHGVHMLYKWSANHNKTFMSWSSGLWHRAVMW
jgi:hypothetical protein